MKQVRTNGSRDALGPRVHYGWIVAFVGGISVFCGLGLARFAFGILLPSMSSSLDWSYAQAGFLGFANLLGYLVSVLIIPSILGRWRTRVTVTLGLLLVAGSMFSMVFAQSLPLLSALYFLTGIGSGVVVVPSMSAMANWFAPSSRGLATGLVMTGPGFGIIFSGTIVPHLSAFHGILDWQLGWLVFSGITVFVAVIAFAFLRDHPDQLGLSPYGQGTLQAKTKQAKTKTRAGVTPPTGRARFRLIAHMGVIYSIYGATYMLYVTFIVTSMHDSYGMSYEQAGALWSWFGVLCIPSGLAFGALSDRLGRRVGLMLGFATLGIAFACVGFSTWLITLYISVVLFGAAAWSIPVVMSAAAGDYFGPAGTAKALATLTLIFSAGQASGPALAGALAEYSGDFSSSYMLAAVLAGLAIAFAAMLRDPVCE